MIIDTKDLSNDLLEVIVEALINDEQYEIALEILKEHGNRSIIADDGNYAAEYEDQDSLKEAANEYVSEDYDFENNNVTQWITVCAWNRYTLGDYSLDDEESIESFEVELPPVEPDCSEEEHEWVSPYDVVGGLKENPGVWGKGGGVIYNEVCKHCGCLKVTDTWAQNPTNGVQGLTSVRFETEHDYYDGWEKWKVEQD